MGDELATVAFSLDPFGGRNPWPWASRPSFETTRHDPGGAQMTAGVPLSRTLDCCPNEKRTPSFATALRPTRSRLPGLRRWLRPQRVHELQPPRARRGCVPRSGRRGAGKSPGWRRQSRRWASGAWGHAASRWRAPEREGVRERVRGKIAGGASTLVLMLDPKDPGETASGRSRCLSTRP
jgi:hypothetical protein